MNNEIKTALIMAGGTGGHVFPALAVADLLRCNGIRVHWLGTKSGIEANLIPKFGFEISFVNVQGLRGNGAVRLLMAPFKILYATIMAMKVLIKVKPNFVLGMGGFVTGPGGLASRLLLLPLIIHEQNAIPGMTNKLLSKIATRVLQAFPNTFSESSKTHHTGNPIRQSILDLEAPEIRFNDRDEELRILIVGGSLGAQALNETVPQALAISGTQNKLNIWHQAGKNKLEETIQAYDSANVKAMVVEFIDDMDEAYAWADLIICRAGAMTIAELCAVGLAAILIPYPYAVDDHQTANAKYLVEANAAILIQQNELSAHKLANELHKIIHAGRELLLKMATRAFALARPDATSSVMQHCLEVAK